MASSERLLDSNSQPSCFKKMFRVKPLDTIIKQRRDTLDSMGSGSIGSLSQPQLEKTLTVKDLIAFGIGSTVGSGIFVVAGTAGKYHSGAALPLSFLIGGISCLFCGLCYAEFATRIPVAGSAYTYAYASLGEIIGFLIGWDLTLEYGISAATVAQGWSNYLLEFLLAIGINQSNIPDFVFGTNIPSDIYTLNLMAGILIALCSLLLVYGIKESAKFNLVVTVWNVTLILVFSIAGIFYVDPNNWWHPCSNTKCPSGATSSLMPFGIQGVFSAAGIVFFSFVGFDAVSTLAEETKNPRRDMVLGILGTLIIATTLYILVSIILLGMIPFYNLNENAPLADAFKQHNNQPLRIIVAFGALTTTMVTTLTSLIGQPRIYYRMAVDGLFFRVFGKIHPRYKTPHVGSVFTGVGAAAIAMFVNFNLLADMISVGTLMAYILVCGGVICLRYPSKEGLFGGANLALLVGLYFVCCMAFGFTMTYRSSIPSNLQWLAYIPGALVALIFCTFLYIHNTVKPKMNPHIFMCPWVPVIPALGIAVNSYMMASLKYESFLRVIGWMAIGVALYFGYGYQHSKLNNLQDLVESMKRDYPDDDIVFRYSSKDGRYFVEDERGTETAVTDGETFEPLPQPPLGGVVFSTPPVPAEEGMENVQGGKRYREDWRG